MIGTLDEHVDATPLATRADRRPARALDTILLVEDDDGVRTFARRVLQRQGYTVHAVRDPLQAFEFAATRDDDVGLVVTDLILPGMTGDVMAATLRERYPRMRVLYVSGYLDSGLVRGATESAFLAKPFTAPALAWSVRVVAEGRRGTSDDERQL